MDIIAKASTKKTAVKSDTEKLEQEPVNEAAAQSEAKPVKKRTTSRKKTVKAAPEASEGGVAATETAEAAVTESEAKPKKKRTYTRKKAVKAEETPASAAETEGYSFDVQHSTEDGLPTKYDMHSNQRYVDLTSKKTDFEKMLDDLSKISVETLKWDLEKFTKKYSDGDEDAMAKKFEAFYGGFITNAALELYGHGYGEAAFRCIAQTQQILEAKRKLDEEVAEIKAKEKEAAVDISFADIFGGGDNEGESKGE